MYIPNLSLSVFAPDDHVLTKLYLYHAQSVSLFLIVETATCKVIGTSFSHLLRTKCCKNGSFAIIMIDAAFALLYMELDI